MAAQIGGPDVAARVVLKPATVGSVTELGSFRTIELTGDRLIGAEWTPELSWLERVGMLRQAEQEERRRHDDL